MRQLSDGPREPAGQLRRVDPGGQLAQLAARGGELDLDLREQRPGGGAFHLEPLELVGDGSEPQRRAVAQLVPEPAPLLTGGLDHAPA